MFIQSTNFNQKYQITTFQSKKPKVANSTLMSIRDFSKLVKIDEKNMRKALKNGELEMVGKKVNIVAEKTKTFVQKFLRLVSIKKFEEITSINRKALEKSIAIGELELTGKKIDLESEKTKAYLKLVEDKYTTKKLSEILGVNVKSIRQGIRNGEIETSGNKIIYSSPRTQNFIKKQEEKYQNQLRRQIDPTHMGKKTLAKKMGVTVKTIENLIKKGTIIPNKDGSINITTEINKEFTENYTKYNAEKFTRYNPQKYNKLQTRLGKLPIEYCLKYGLLIAEEDGTILTQKEPNKSFLDKIDKKEITHHTYFMNIKILKEYFDIGHQELKKAITSGKLVREKGLGFDINNETNKSFLSKYSKK